MLTCSLLVLICTITKSQVNLILQLPPTGIIKKSQLWNMSLVSTDSKSRDVYIGLTLYSTSDNQPVLTAKTGTFNISKGVKQINYNDVNPVIYNYMGSSFDIDRSPDGFLPIGNYRACFVLYQIPYELTKDESVQMAEDCLPIEVQPLSPPLLNTPADKDTLDISYPNFSWIPPSPLNLFNNLSYDLIVVEVMSGQTALDAFQQNLPVYNVSNLKNAIHVYPASAKALDTGRVYAWRIVAKNNYENVAQSDNWTFTIRARNKMDVIPQISLSSYVKLTREVQSGFVHCEKNLLFQYRNEIGDTILHYKIINLMAKDNTPEQEGKLNVKFGINYLKIPLQTQKGKKKDDIYMLKLINSRNEEWVLKFISDYQ